jgi:uncharacterized protein (TIGR02246 family)
MREFDSLPPADQEAVGATLTALQTGFARRDADALLDAYTDDADWVNAFGTAKKGRKQSPAGRRPLADRV